MAIRITFRFLFPTLLAGGAMAGVLPPDGVVDSSLCFGGPMQMVAAGPGHQLGRYAVMGGTSAADLVFDSMVADCSGTFETRYGRTQSAGRCTFRDADGDSIEGSDTNTTEGGYVWAFSGGTGKFQGITGSGRIEREGTLAPGDGRMRGCRKLVGTYKIR